MSAAAALPPPPPLPPLICAPFTPLHRRSCCSSSSWCRAYSSGRALRRNRQPPPFRSLRAPKWWHRRPLSVMMSRHSPWPAAWAPAWRRRAWRAAYWRQQCRSRLRAQTCPLCCARPWARSFTACGQQRAQVRPAPSMPGFHGCSSEPHGLELELEQLTTALHPPIPDPPPALQSLAASTCSCCGAQRPSNSCTCCRSSPRC